MKRQGACMIFINDKKKVLLFLRDNKDGLPYPNMWCLLGGTVERGEKPEIAVAREMKEELGIEIQHPQLYKVVEFPDRIENIFWQHLELAESQLNLQLKEGQRVSWFSKKEIEKMVLAFEFNKVVEKFMASAKD
jgi:8-oxo-dGTP diphosphatase